MFQGLPIEKSDEWGGSTIRTQPSIPSDTIELYSRDNDICITTASPKHDVSAVILTDTVQTGSEFR